MVAPDALDAVGRELDALAWSEFGEEDVWVDGSDVAVGFGEMGGLLAGGLEGYLVGVDYPGVSRYRCTCLCLVVATAM